MVFLREKSARVAVVAAPQHTDADGTDDEEQDDGEEEVDDPDILSDLPDDMEVRHLRLLHYIA